MANDDRNLVQVPGYEEKFIQETNHELQKIYLFSLKL